MELIKVFKNSLSQTICQNIINIYEDADNKKDGEVIAGINKNIKLSLDLHSSIIEPVGRTEDTDEEIADWTHEVDGILVELSVGDGCVTPL